MQVMLEGVGGDWVLQAERVPATAQSEHNVKSANLIVERARVGVHGRNANAACVSNAIHR
jgi:hypothetical protein